MDIIEALKYKYELNKWIRQQLFAKHGYSELFHILSENESFIDFLMTRIGQIWLKKGYGKTYSDWLEHA